MEDCSGTGVGEVVGAGVAVAGTGVEVGAVVGATAATEEDSEELEDELGTLEHPASSAANNATQI